MRKKLALHGVNHRKIPEKYIDVEIPTLARQGVDHGAEGFREFIIVLAVADQSQFAVQVPSDDKDGPARPAHGLAHGPEIIFAVNDKRRAMGMSQTPAILTFDKNGSIIPDHQSA
jgi:hypothetical protein